MEVPNNTESGNEARGWTWQDGWIEQPDPQNFTPPQADNHSLRQENKDSFSEQIDQVGSNLGSCVLKTRESESTGWLVKFPATTGLEGRKKK